MQNKFHILSQALGKDNVIKQKDLFPYLTLKVHVVAEFFYEATGRRDFINAVSIAVKAKIPFFIMGGGSNIVFTQPTIKGLVIKNNYQEQIVIKENTKIVHVNISSGYIVPLLVKKTVEAGWEGFEYHEGLPGTLGGAIYMNSKWTKPWSFFGDNLVSAVLIDKKGNIKQVNHDYFQFGYDYSILQDTKEILVEGIFELKKNNPTILAKRSQGALLYRKQTQPTGVATAGCFFKNITEKQKKIAHVPTTSSGYLIDKAGLKGLQIGSFQVSPLHANFIINIDKNKGNANDLLQLVRTIKDKVKKMFNIILVEEVVLI